MKFRWKCPRSLAIYTMQNITRQLGENANMVNAHPEKLGKTERMSFSHINEVLEMPNLIDVQKSSYRWFLDEGLKEVFRDISTIEDYTGNLVLDFTGYRLEDDKPKYSVEECKARDATYNAPLKVMTRLFNKETGEIKEQEIFMGDFPLMTDSATFVINGAERVVVSQLVRSPGVYFDKTRDKSGKELFSAQVIPNRGAWLEYETDLNDIFYVRIDKNRKMPVTVFLRALGLGTNQEILDFFGNGAEFASFGLEDQIVFIDTDDWAIWWNLNYVECINLLELLGLGKGSTGHTRKFAVKTEEVLERNRGKRH